MSEIEVVIDELVLTGFNPADRDAIAAALESELARLLSVRGLAASALAQAGEEPGRLDAGSFSVRAPRDGAAVGAGVARAVYGALATSPDQPVRAEMGGGPASRQAPAGRNEAVDG